MSSSSSLLPLLLLTLLLSSLLPTLIVAEEDETTTTMTSNTTTASWSSSSVVPVNVSVLSATRSSISLQWGLTGLADWSAVNGYRIFFAHRQYEDVKTIHVDQPQYELQGLEPYTAYRIWVQVLVNGEESSVSSPIVAHTDVGAPGQPHLFNVSCHDTNAIYVAWSRPKVYDKSVDAYKLYYRIEGDNMYRTIDIMAGDHEEESKDQGYFLQKLLGRHTYLVKVAAVTRSVSEPNRTHTGVPSVERAVYLPHKKCLVDEDNAEERKRIVLTIVGLGGGGAVVFILFFFAIITWRRYTKRNYYHIEEGQCAMGSSLLPSSGIPEWEETIDHKPVSSAKFGYHVQQMHVDSDIGFAKEYEELKSYCDKELSKLSHDQCSHPDNKSKNRYLNIVSYDHSRVILSSIGGVKRSDYINANFIDGFEKFNAYIGTQGPLEETCDAFWRMVWEHNVHVIVMITNLVERGRRKCDMYWPKEIGKPHVYDSIEVELSSELVMANYTVRKMQVRHLKLKRKKGMVGERCVTQYHYTSWPDHGVPAHPLPVLAFVRKSSNSNPFDGGPIIVHCSAGVGRTGCYVTIDSVLRQMRARGSLNVYGYLRHIRRQRNHLVQTEEQYVFIHDALLEALRCGVTEVKRQEVANHVDRLETETPFGETQTLIDKQFKLITDFKPQDFQISSALKDYNTKKNRDPHLIPCEAARVHLSPRPGVEGSDYINASWLHGHRDLREFIVTQHPGEDSKMAFWQMVWDHNAQTIVLLSSVESVQPEETDEGYLPTFWPVDSEEFDLSAFRVRFIEKNVHEGHSTLDFVLSSCQDDYELTVRVIYCPDWPQALLSLRQPFEVLRVVQDWHLEYQHGPLVVVDRDGGTDAASFCALTTLRNQLETTATMDVFQVAKLYHYNRPGIWRSKDDIVFLYKAMAALVRSSPIRCSSISSAAVAAANKLNEKPDESATTLTVLSRCETHHENGLSNGLSPMTSSSVAPESTSTTNTNNGVLPIVGIEDDEVDGDHEDDKGNVEGHEGEDSRPKEANGCVKTITIEDEDDEEEEGDETTALTVDLGRQLSTNVVTVDENNQGGDSSVNDDANNNEGVA